MKKNIMNKKINMGVILILSFVLSIALLTGCGQAPKAMTGSEIQIEEAAGVLLLKVNPEIKIHYNADGLVTSVSAHNDDGAKILETYKGFEGKDCKVVVNELVGAIGKAGYFIEEIDGKSRTITIEIEKGSLLPNDRFLKDIADSIRTQVNQNKWKSPVALSGITDYGITDYNDTDYGPNNDGVTDYNDTDYGPNNDGVTDYKDTDYGPNNDGVTDYKDTDYGPNNDGVTDYKDTDYGPNNDGVTDYKDTDYGPNNDGVTDYNTRSKGNSNYGNSNYGNSGYDD